LADDIKEKEIIPYSEIPHFPVSTVKGHSGNMVIGKLGNKNIVAMQGRFHIYEGYTANKITFPIRVMAHLGVNTFCGKRGRRVKILFLNQER